MYKNIILPTINTAPSSVAIPNYAAAISLPADFNVPQYINVSYV